MIPLKQIKSLLIILPIIFFAGNSISQIQIDEGQDKEYYLNIVKLYAPSEDAFIALQYLAKPFIDKRDWKKAAKVYEDNLRNFKLKEEWIKDVIKILLAQTEGRLMVNLGGNINSLGREYSPVLTPDMRKIYFTGREREDDIGGEDIYISYYNNRWSISNPLFGKINTESNEYINSISADGNLLLLFGNYLNSLGRGDNFYAERTPIGWSEVKPFPEPINSKFWDADAFITADGNAIVFASERPGNIGEFHQKGNYHHGMYWGNTDLYVVVKEGNGWSKTAINLGDWINTPYTERTPFLHPDGKTLYFSSDGHPGLGKSDVFKSIRLNDSSWTEWSEPINLGKEVNTADEDWGYKITTDGRRAYFSTINDMGFGEEDIYYIDLPEIAKPQSSVVTVVGKVIDENGNPVEALIRWEDFERTKDIGSAKTDPQSGEFLIALPIGKSYAYYAEVKGYYGTVNYLDLTKAESYKEIETTVNLISVEGLISSGKAIKIENIFFDSGKYELKEESFESLSRLFKFLHDNDELVVEINAHTDNIGSDEYNLNLSNNRASSVVNYLVSKGIDATKLIAQGFGESQPVAPNDTDEGRALNRRVEFKLRRK